MTSREIPEGGITYRLKQLETKVDSIVRAQEQADRDRKVDRRYQIGAVFTSAALIISAIAALGDKL